MTLLIAAKSGAGIQPNGTQFSFESGIVIAADTRLSDRDRVRTDEGLKVGVAGVSAICGMAGDSIDIPTMAFNRFDGFMHDHPDISAVDAANQLQAMLPKLTKRFQVNLDVRIS